MFNRRKWLRGIALQILRPMVLDRDHWVKKIYGYILVGGFNPSEKYYRLCRLCEGTEAANDPCTQSKKYESQLGL